MDLCPEMSGHATVRRPDPVANTDQTCDGEQRLATDRSRQQGQAFITVGDVRALLSPAGNPKRQIAVEAAGGGSIARIGGQVGCRVRAAQPRAIVLEKDSVAVAGV